MNVIKTAIEGVLIIEPRIFEDARGYFFESFSQREFDEKVLPLLQTSAISPQTSLRFVQDNESKSSYGSDMTVPSVLNLRLHQKNNSHLSPVNIIKTANL